jgi:cob(I)alamin adenosyltransferase
VRIYTRTGDAGETGLFAGGRVPKDHPRVSACGDVDELNAALGVAMTLEPADADRELLEAIQRDLFAIGSELATPDPAKVPPGAARPFAGDARVAALERAIDACEAELAPLREFILPGGTPKAAAFHLSRTVCRRAERAVVRLARDSTVSPPVLRYLNRLSDLLFVLARATNARAGVRDVTW